MRNFDKNYIKMKTLTLNIPDKLDLNLRETSKFLAAKLYESGKLSLGQAAELAGLSKVAFSEILSDFDVSLFNYPPSDIIRDEAQL
jgi:predicted HTH domain antitoxin